MTGKELEALLGRLCIDLGFCLPHAEQLKMTSEPPPTIDEFVDAVFRGEGLNPEHVDRHLYRQVRKVVAEAFDG